MLKVLPICRPSLVALMVRIGNREGKFSISFLTMKKRIPYQKMTDLLPDTKLTEYRMQNIIGGDCAGDAGQVIQGVANVNGQ